MLNTVRIRTMPKLEFQKSSALVREMSVKGANKKAALKVASNIYFVNKERGKREHLTVSIMSPENEGLT
jgi:hypothetical protein